MSQSALTIAASTCQCLTIACSLCAYVPQWTTLYRRKSSDDISLKAWFLWITCTLLGLFYALSTYFTSGVGLALVFTDVTSICFIAVTIGMILRYRKTKVDDTQQIRNRLSEVADKADAVAIAVSVHAASAEQTETKSSSPTETSAAL